MNQSRARSCTGKLRHPNHRAATAAARVTGERSGDITLEPYRCRFCGGYHVGHPLKSTQKRLHYTRLLKLIEKANAKELP